MFFIISHSYAFLLAASMPQSFS